VIGCSVHRYRVRALVAATSISRSLSFCCLLFSCDPCPPKMTLTSPLTRGNAPPPRLPAAEVVEVLWVLLVVGEVVEVGRSSIPDGVLEVSAIPEGVTHIFVVQALGVEDVVQCSFASTGCPSGTRDGWSSVMDFFTRPLLPALVGLLVRVTPWFRWSKFCSPDEVLGPFVGGDVEVRLPEKLLGSGRRLL
jgi:hypothetical protein